jgi:Transposase IS66 family
VQVSAYTLADETPIRVIDPTRPGAAREAWLWSFLAPEPEVVVLDFQLTRSHEPALAFLRQFAGVFQFDGFAAYLKALRLGLADRREQIVHANCMAHFRLGIVGGPRGRRRPGGTFSGLSRRSLVCVRPATPRQRLDCGTDDVVMLSTPTS